MHGHHDFDLYEAIYTTRSMRRLKPDPVDPALIVKVIEAATMGPSGHNRQPWIFIVVTEQETKNFVAERYRKAWETIFTPTEREVVAREQAEREAPTDVVQFGPDGQRRWTLDPARYGVRATRAEILGGDVATNAAALLAILDGERSPRADLVILNAALALVVAGEAVDVDDGMVRARTSVERGRARAALDALRRERRTLEVTS